MTLPNIHLAVALDGAGWHPAAWREPSARPGELQSARYSEPDDRTDRVRGRVDAVLIAARVAPLTRHIGLIPTVVVTHTEPFHISKAIATLDYVSNGRAGVRVRVSASPAEAAHFGRRSFPPAGLRDRADPEVARLVAALFDEAADYVEVVRRLWDSWEDDAEIRDVATGRFIDRAKLHYIDFTGAQFSVKGPSITPRPPQGQPLVAALGHATVPFGLIAKAADVGFVTPRSADEARSIVSEVRSLAGDAGRDPGAVRVFGDLVVFLDTADGSGADRKARLDERAGEEYASDAAIFTGGAADLADLLLEWHSAGLAGFRLRPGAIPADLAAITRGLVPELQRRGAFRTGYDAGSLRGRLGLPRPASRYAAATGGN
jgi:alkanesulfonate monooxygenase SsuD/methylene tetrahydromethanopterin reductase-like flavin-dependent oxidoreductase (luciferase family)